VAISFQDDYFEKSGGLKL